MSGIRGIVRIGATILLLYLACLPVQGFAAEAPEPLFEIPKRGGIAGGASAGRLATPVGIATDQSGENVYIAEEENSRISVFSPWGVFRMAFGGGVVDGSPESQVCTAVCQKGVPGTGPGVFATNPGPEGVAVDGNGNVYVVDRGNMRVQKFDSSGEFILMFGGEVNQTTGGNLCTAASGDSCGAGVEGSGSGEFSGWHAGTFIAVAPDDRVYVGDKGRIQIFNPDGSYASEITLSREVDVGALAIDPVSGDIYYAYNQIFSPEDETVFHLASDGSPVCTMSVVRVRALATDTEGSVYAVSDPPVFGVPDLEPIVEKFDSDCSFVESFGRSPVLSTTLEGIAVNRIGDVYLSRTNQGEEASYVSVYGPPPSEIEPAPEEPATVASQFASSATDTGAVLKAQINPHFFGSSTYYVEYGTEDCAAPGASCQITPAPPGASLGGGERDADITANGIALSGLSPDTTYYFRFVAISGKFTTKGLGSDEEGASSTFHTRRSPGEGLPDNRAYEKVSPQDKNHGEMAVPQSSTGGAVENGMVKPLQASPGGDGITFPSFAAFGEAQGGPAATQYLARREAGGWVTRNITPPARSVPPRDPLRGFSEDLATGAVIQHDPPLVEGATPGVENLYLQENDTRTLQLLTPEAPRLKEVDPDLYCIGYFGASEDMSHVIFLANGSLTPEAPESLRPNLYEWVAGIGIRLVSVLPSETPATPSPGTGFGQGPGGGANCSVTESLTYRAISADGRRIFWTDGARLYARIDGVETIALDANKGGAGPAGGGRYWGASKDGARVFFTAPGKLVPGAKGGDLYRYDFNAEELKAVSAGSGGAAEVMGVLGVDEDGSRAYFAAKAALAPGATAGKPNLYLWDEEEGLRFIATLSGAGDSSNWGGQASSPLDSFPERQTSRLTPDGAHLAFLSAARLTGYDNTGQSSGKAEPQVFLYDAEEERLSCASCNSTGARPLGPSDLISWAVPFQQPRYLSEDGARLFFESSDALAQADTNQKQDVYEFERAGKGSCTTASASYDPASEGCTELVSSGTSNSDTYLLDASTTGDDVFISTRQRLLLGSDLDDRYDVYDARVGGGFPEPPPPPAPCTGEACRAPAVPPPAMSPPPSATINDPGNVKEPKHNKHHKKKCKKAKKSKKGKCKGKAKSKSGRQGR